MVLLITGIFWDQILLHSLTDNHSTSFVLQWPHKKVNIATGLDENSTKLCQFFTKSSLN